MRAVWKGAVLAQAERTVVVEDNDYFPPESLNRGYVSESRRRSLCLWKGIARYYGLIVDGQDYANAAWCYPHPSLSAKKIKSHVAFSNGVTVEAVPEPGR
ncbi:DUF427 domain-containing protein [Streptomyces bathyalis]|uniref:DUF427 domain-containing protein n=1 Tax=Streptomyces bathyalis TaxID=2710756 RepID=A0A7T1T466_9ACTN|nr:DUF427 domain-containing protein [Streptomyces bathyalis]QPP06045.1 DUF427 domain-containing protein [Streptomyces bathyalis]